MQTDMLMEAHLGRLFPFVLSLFLLMHWSWAAPGLTGAQGTGEPLSTNLANPFGSGEEERRLLQSYIQSSVRDTEVGPAINTWEQEVFFLLRLYDYDRSGLLDGLEMMKLLSEYNSHQTSGAHAHELVVSMVDFLLQTQDLNHDGLLAPLELLSPPLPLTQDSGNDEEPHHVQEIEVEKLSNPSHDQEEAGIAADKQEHQEEIQLQDEQQPHEDVRIEDDTIKQIEEQNDVQHVLVAPAAEQRHEQEVSVHHRQPEI